MKPKKTPKPQKPMHPRISTRQKVFLLYSDATVMKTINGNKQKAQDVYDYFLEALAEILK